jgi:imidazolonepropionase-like amidohydrolase
MNLERNLPYSGGISSPWHLALRIARSQTFSNHSFIELDISNAKVLEMTGKTVIPGLVGMHEHLFYPTPQEPQGGLAFYGEAPDSAPRLYLAGG